MQYLVSECYSCFIVCYFVEISELSANPRIVSETLPLTFFIENGSIILIILKL